jgi:hypothetical protein
VLVQLESNSDDIGSADAVGSYGFGVEVSRFFGISMKILVILSEFMMIWNEFEGSKRGKTSVVDDRDT